MDPSINDLRNTLESSAHAHEAPDPHTVLAGAESRAKVLGRQRTAARWAAVAAAVVAIGGASLLVGGADDLATQIDPAVPNESYDDGYGIVDGEIRPYMDGMELVDVATVGAGQQRLVQVDSVDGAGQLYAVAWCPDLPEDEVAATGVMAYQSGNPVIEGTCHERSQDANSNRLATALPPLDDGYLISNGTSRVADVAIYRESAWNEYPFPSPDPVPFATPTPGTVVIDTDTPLSRSEGIDALPDGRQVFQARVPITDEVADLKIDMNTSGQVLVAINGVVVTNDGEDLPGRPNEISDAWQRSDPALRHGFVTSFGAADQRGYAISRESLESYGVDASDEMFDITVYPQGFVDRSAWRVSYEANAQDAASATSRLSPEATTTLPEYAYGHRRVATYEVPAAGTSRAMELPPSHDAASLTWVVQCPELLPDAQGNFQPEIGTVSADSKVGPLTCFGEDQGWTHALRPEGFSTTSSRDVLPMLTLRAADGTDPLVVAAYEPLSYEDFPFDQAADVSSIEAPTDGETFGEGNDESVYRETMRVTSSELDTNGTVLIDVPQSMFTELYVSTEGVGRFWLDPTEPGGEPVTPQAKSTEPASVYGAQDFWTSWTGAKTTWVITPETDAGVAAEQVRLRVEGYEEGSFELQVFGLFGADDQP